MTTDQVLNKKEIVELCDVRAGELVIHASLPDRYEAWIESHEQAIRAEIAKRYTPGGFLRKLSKIHLLQLQAATTISLDLETTALTPYSETVNITKQTKFGELSRDAYYAAHPGVSISDTSPRIRVMGLYLPLTDQSLLFDLDHMAPADVQLLIDTVLDGKILIGHNIFGFDLYWLFHRSSKRPSNVLDTLMMVRQCKPEILSYANFDAAGGSAERLAEIEEDRDVALTASASLEAISIQLNLPRPEKAWQKPQNWALSELSADHLTYVEGDITSPCRILTHIFGTIDGRAIVNHIKADYPWYRDYHKAAMRTTEAVVRGIPFDNERAVELKAELAIEIAAKAEAMKQWPEFAGDEIFKELANPAKGTTKRVREAIHGLAKAADVVLPLTDKSKKLMETYEEEKAKLGNENLAIPEKINISLSKKALMFANIDLPVLNDYVSLAEVKKLHELIEDWQFFARVDGKLHPLYAWTTAAGRASTSEPNPLGAPRDKRIRGLLCHTAGYKVAVVDFNAIELRVAVANAARAIEEVIGYLTNCNPKNLYDIFNGTQAWFLTTCYTAQLKQPTQYPGDTPPDGTTKDEWQKEKAAHIITYFASRVLGKNVQSLASVFQFGVDPHLATALTMLRIQGEIDFTGSATEYLASFSAEEQEQLKEKYKDARQQAKAVNFGLLYGMMPEALHRYGVTSYGLKWKLDEAKAAYSMWFELYPEIGFLHCFIRYMKSTKVQPEEVKLWDKFTRKYKSKPYPVKRFKTNSLAGRPFDVLDHQNAAFSYPGQGSGADLTVRAIANLPEDLADSLMLVVHDEIVLMLPEQQADAALVTLKRIMNEAGDELLGPYCKCAAEGKVHDRWQK